MNKNQSIGMYVILGIMVLAFISMLFSGPTSSTEELSYTTFLQKVENKEIMYDYMIENTNPDYVFFQMDLYWVVRGQHSPVDYFKKYPGRFKMFHVKDDREIGQSGMVGFDAIFKNASIAGVQDIVAEIEGYTCPVEKSVEISLDYLLDAPFVKKSYNR